MINKQIDFPGKNGLKDWVSIYVIAYLIPYLLLSLINKVCIINYIKIFV